MQEKLFFKDGIDVISKVLHFPVKGPQSLTHVENNYSPGPASDAEFLSDVLEVRHALQVATTGACRLELELVRYCAGDSVVKRRVYTCVSPSLNSVSVSSARVRGTTTLESELACEKPEISRWTD